MAKWRIIGSTKNIYYVNRSGETFEIHDATPEFASRVVACLNVCDGIEDLSSITDMIDIAEMLKKFREPMLELLGVVERVK